ncbi:3678_t:CDS:2, partial [Acaulospora morrowiae]
DSKKFDIRRLNEFERVLQIHHNNSDESDQQSMASQASNHSSTSSDQAENKYTLEEMCHTIAIGTRKLGGILGRRRHKAFMKEVKSERSRIVNKLKCYWKGMVAERKRGPGKKGKGKENINTEGTSTQPLNVRVLRKRNHVDYSEVDFSDVDSHVGDVEKRNWNGLRKKKNELEVRIVELERSARENIELRSRVAKLEQKLSQNDSRSKDAIASEEKSNHIAKSNKDTSEIRPKELTLTITNLQLMSHLLKRKILTIL